MLRFVKSNTLLPGPSQDEQAICNIIFMQKVIWETIIGSYLKQNNSDLVFQTRTSSSESTFQTFSKIEAKIVLAAMLEAKNIIIQIQANSNHTTFLKNQSAIKYFPKSKKLGVRWCQILASARFQLIV